MIELKTENGHCKLTLEGTCAELSKDTQVIIHAVYNAIMKSVPDFTKTAYGNFFRISVMKAATDCNQIDFNSSYPHDMTEP